MSKIQVSIEVEQATLAVAQAVGQVVVDVVNAQKNNPTLLQNAETIGQAILLDIVPVASDFSMLYSDAQDSIVDFLEAWNVAGIQTYQALTGKTKAVKP
jgi:hypothetical protein